MAAAVGGGCAADAQAEYADENEIADDVHKTADDQHPQRGPGCCQARAAARH